MFTVEQIREDIAPFTLESGRCKDSASVLKFINTARRLMWPRGNFPGIMDTLRIRAVCGQVTLPYDYQKAIEARSCRDTIQIDNEWYEAANNITFGENSCWGAMIDLGDRFASFQDYIHGNHRLMVKAEIREDEGKAISFNTIGEHGDRVEISGLLGADHVPVYFNPWIKYFRYASKEATIGRVRVYIHDPNRGADIVCAIYEADDLSPSYRRYRTPGGAAGYYYLRCKRRYRDLLRDTDEVEFGTDSIIQACIAINKRRASDNAAFTTAMNLAVEHENQLLKDDKPPTGGRIKFSARGKVENLVTSSYASFPHTDRRICCPRDGNSHT